MKKLILILIASFTVQAEDFYQMLGVTRDADEKAIKKAFKKLSLEYHPDRRNSDSEEKFMKLSHAYEVLTTPEKKEIYDRYGEEGLKGGRNYNHEEIYDNYFGHKNPHMMYNHAPFYQNSEVINLSTENVKNLYRRNEIWLVKFYGPRCRYCQELVGQWKDLASRLYGIVKIAAVNCDEAESLCVDYNIKKYPVIIYFPDNTLIDHEVYQGEKNVDKLSEFALSKVTGFLRFVNFNNIDEFLQSDMDKVKLLTFTDAKESPYLIKVLSKEFKEKAVFGHARSTDSILVSRYGITQYPSLLTVSPVGFEKYEQAFQRNSIESWIYKLLDTYKILIFARELNRSLYASGNCNFLDSKFCLISFDPDDELKEILNRLAQDFQNDPVEVFWLNKKKYSNFAAEFQGEAVIYRGKKQKFTSVDCKKDYNCYKETLSNVLSGGGSFTKIKNYPEMIEKKPEL